MDFDRSYKCIICFMCLCVVRGAKELSVVKWTDGGVQNIARLLNGFSRVAVFSDDGSLFAFCDGKR